MAAEFARKRRAGICFLANIAPHCGQNHIADQQFANCSGRTTKATPELVPNTCEYQDASAFNGKDWRDVSDELLRQHSDAVYGFSPESFCYYLPGIMTACIQGGNVRLACVDVLINSLNRSPNPDYWDEFFVKRWTLLSVHELEAVQQWVLWLLDFDSAYFEDGSLDRVIDTLDLLARR